METSVSEVYFEDIPIVKEEITDEKYIDIKIKLDYYDINNIADPVTKATLKFQYEKKRNDDQLISKKKKNKNNKYFHDNIEPSLSFHFDTIEEATIAKKLVDDYCYEKGLKYNMCCSNKGYNIHQKI